MSQSYGRGPQRTIPTHWEDWSTGQRQRLLATWHSLVQRDPHLSSVIFVLDMQIGGQRLLVSTHPVRLTSGTTGAVLQYLPALVEVPRMQRSTDVMSQQAQPRSLSVQLLPGVLDLDEVLQRGLPFTGVAELSMTVQDGDYDLRYVLMRGSIVGGVSFGADAEPVTMQLQDMRSHTDDLAPSVTLDDARWPLAHESAIGKRLPLVINGYPSVPALRVLDDHASTGLKYAICSHDFQEFSGSTVYVNGETAAGGFAPATVSTEGDGLGTPTLLVDFSSSAGPWEDNEAVHVDVDLADSTKALDVIDTIRALLARYTSLGERGLNADMFSYAQARMPALFPGVLVNSSGTSTARVMELIESGLLKSYPMVRLAYQGRGLGPMVVDRRSGVAERGYRGDFTVGSGPILHRSSEYTESPQETCFTEYEIRYGFNTQTRSYSGVSRRDPTHNAMCRAMLDALSVQQPMEPIDSPHIQSQADAEYVADWLVAHRAIPSYFATFQCLPMVWMMLRLGDNILITDPDRAAFTRAVATVMQLEEGVGIVTMGLRIWHPYWTSLTRVRM